MPYTDKKRFSGVKIVEKRPIAYQIYSAREEAEKNLSGVLEQLAGMGYKGVEFAGFYGISADEIVALLAKYNLQAISSHVPVQLLEEDTYGVLPYHRKIGCKYIATAYLDDATRPGAPGFARMIRLMHKFGRLCRTAGIQLLYHNHDFEFIEFSCQYGLDFLYDAVPEKLLKTELDTCGV